jgi:hypothetical protein
MRGDNFADSYPICIKTAEDAEKLTAFSKTGGKPPLRKNKLKKFCALRRKYASNSI